MRILRATHLGMCFGVRDAIALVKAEAARAPLTVYGALAHNPTIVDDLVRHGVTMVNRDEAVPTKQVVTTAHGVSQVTLDRLKAGGHAVREATCPLVHVAHRALKSLIRSGCFPVIVGQREHVEVKGMTEDLAEFEVILSETDVQAMTEKPSFGVVAQTTQPIDRVRHLVKCLRQRFPNSKVEFMDTVCQPTKQRQSAAVELASASDVVIVIGGRHSNNTKELTHTCRGHCERVFQIEGPEELNAEWLNGCEVVGITAGTSTPDEVIDAVERKLRAFIPECAQTLAG